MSPPACLPVHCADNVAGLGIPVGIAQMLGYANEVSSSADQHLCRSAGLCAY